MLISALERVGPVDWQPCVAGAYADCVSVSPPTCKRTSLSATTQSDQQIDLPRSGVHEPGQPRATSVVMVLAAATGTLAGQRYTPAPGFVGQDELRLPGQQRLRSSPSW